MSTAFAMRSADIARALDARLAGADVAVAGVSTDTRTIGPGQLFVALKGGNFDGHDYLVAAAQRGAAAALVSRELADVAIPQIVVADTRLALGRLAKHWRERHAGADTKVLALTGSNGKTTVKEMLRSILELHAGTDAVLATEGNLNNDFGLPQMLLRLAPRHRYAVFEMGMNHLGEIDYLTRLATPDVAMVTMAGTAHIGELGSREAIAQAKGEIFAGLKPDGIAVVNMHDRFGQYWRDLAAGHRVIGFGVLPEDEVQGMHGADYLTIRHASHQVGVRLKVLGEHNRNNALAAAAGALALAVPLDTIQRGLEAFGGVMGRLTTYTGHNSATVIDDTYNANPDSVKAAIRVLAEAASPRCLVLGDMGELGKDSLALHREIGEFARAAGIDRLFALGEATRATVASFGADGTHFDSVEALASALLPTLSKDVTVLVKGSRFMKMERVVAKLVANHGGGHH